MRIRRPAIGKQFTLPLAKSAHDRGMQLHMVDFTCQLYRFQVQLDQLQQLARTRRRL
jgi:hypothetical protein